VALTRNLAWMGLGQGAFFLLQFAGSVVLARLLTPYEMGVYALAAALLGVLAIVQSFGMGSFIVREKALDPDDVVTAFTINVVICLILSGMVLGASIAARSYYANPGVGRVLLVLAAMPLTAIFELLPFAHLERAGRFKLLVAVGMAKNVTATVLTVTCAFAGFSYLSIAYGQVAGAVVSAIALNLVGREHVQFRLSARGWRRLSAFGAQMLAISGVNSLATRLADVLLGRVLGLTALGLYNRAVNVHRLFWDNLHLVIGRVIFVDLAQRKRDGESLRASYLQISEMMTATLWPAFAGLAVLSSPLFAIVYGARWVPAATPFALLAIAAMVQVSITMTWELFTISGETARQARIEFIRTAIGLAMFAAACFVSLTAAAATRVLEAIISMLIYRPHLERMTETRLTDFLPIYARSGLLTGLAVAPAAALMLLPGGGATTPAWRLLAAVAAGVALWGAGLAGLKHPLLKEAQRIVGPRLAALSGRS
jgi:O-antigen/teichoic acid export membrane protein